MNIKVVIKAVANGKCVSENTYETPRGKFSHSGLVVFTDRHKVSVFKNAQLVWATTDEIEIRQVRWARAN
jgi:hypothetical protein